MRLRVAPDSAGSNTALVTIGPGMNESPLQMKAKEFQRRYEADVKKYPGETAQYDIAAIDDNVESSRLLKALIRSVIEELTTMGQMPDDRYGEIVREVGGKGLQKRIREKAGSKFDKIDPGFVIKEIKKSPKKQDKNN